MNHLQICQQLAQHLKAPYNRIVTTAGVSGDQKRVVDAVIGAYRDIQVRHMNWRWLRSQFTFNTVASTDTYAYGTVTDSRLNALITRFSRWITLDDRGFSAITMFPTATGVAGERYLIYLPYSDFRYVYKRGIQTTITRNPVHFTPSPQNQLLLGPNPDSVYTVHGEYQMSPQILALDADIPEMPDSFHDLIVWRAMERLSVLLSHPDLLGLAQTEGNRMMRALEANQLPVIGVGDPLVMGS